MMLKKSINSNKKSVLLISDSFPPKNNSGAIMIHDLINHISNKYNVILLTFSNSMNVNYKLEPFDNYIIVRLKTNKHSNLLARFIAEYSYSNKIIKFFEDNSFIDLDYIISYSPSIFFGKSVTHLKKKFKCKAYLIQRDLFPDWAYKQGLIKSNLLYKFLKFKEIQNYNSADFIGVESKGAFKYIRKLGYKNSEILNNWLFTSKVKYKEYFHLNNNIDYFIYGGNLGLAQDLKTLIKNINYKILKKNNIKILICGSGVQENEIRKIINKSEDTIILVGELSKDAFRSILSRCLAGIVSLSAKTDMNNYPLKFLDYLNHKIPVIAHINKNNELIDFINDNQIGLCSHTNQYDIFSKNLIKFQNKNLYEKFKKNSHITFKNYFSIDNSAKKIFDKI